MDWSGLPGAVGGLVSGVASIFDAKKSRQWQTNERLASQRYNTSERLASQQYNTSERKASQQYQTSEREAQNQYSERIYNQYQSPQALARQYQAAGLNPRLAADTSGVGNAAQASGSNGGAPSGAAPSGTHVSTPSAPQGFTEGFVNIASSLKALAEAKKAGVETMRMEKFMQEEFRGIQLSNISQELANQLQKVDLNVKQQTALKQAFAVLNDTNASWQKKQQELENLKKVGLLTQKQVDTFDEKFKNEMDNLQADTFAKEQAGFNSQQQAISEFIKRDLINAQVEKTIAEVGATNSLKEFTDTQNRLLKLEENVKSASNDNEKKSAVQQYQAEYYKFMYDAFRLYNLIKPRLNGGNNSAMTQFLDGLYELTNSGMPVDVKHVSESNVTVNK